MSLQIPHSLKILKDACKLYGYSFKFVDNFGKNLVEVSKFSKSFYSSNRDFGIYPINPSFSKSLVNDKAWTNTILKEKGYKTIKGEYFFLKKEFIERRKRGREFNDAINYAKGKYPVFVKPNDCRSGIFADLIYSEKELIKHLKKILMYSEIAIIQEFIKLPEYRIFVVDGEVKFFYQRLLPKICGNGRSSIKELIEKLNQTIKNNENKIFLNAGFLKNELMQRNYKATSVLKKGESLNVSSKSNLAAGGSISDYGHIFPKGINKWAKKISMIFSLRVCGIDVFVDGSFDNPNNFIIIEINSSPCLSGIYKAGHKKRALEIWGEILNKFFK